MSALQEVLQALHTVEDHLRLARGQIMQGHRALGEARVALARLDPNNPDTVVPPGLDRAIEQLERTLSIIEHVDGSLREFASRL